MTETGRIDAEAQPSAAANRCVQCGASCERLRFTATDRLYATTQEKFRIVECAGCGLLRLSPRPAAKDLASYYPAAYWFDPRENAAGKFEEVYRRVVLRDHVRFVAKALRRAGGRGPVLDVGCGGGLFLGMLHERGISGVGFDLSSEAATLANRRHGIPAVAGDLTASPFAPASFAVLTMFHVLEHVPDPQQYLLEANRLLQPGGRLIIQVPNASCWQFALLGRAWNGVDAPRHLTLFRDCDLEKMIAAAGFDVQRRKYFSWRDNPAGLATGLAPELDPMARKVRHLDRSSGTRLLKDAVYFALVLASLPFTLLEAAFHAGSTIMIDARKRA
jgi:SAM-dependent methyltransferase